MPAAREQVYGPSLAFFRFFFDELSPSVFPSSVFLFSLVCFLLGGVGVVLLTRFSLGVGVTPSGESSKSFEVLTLSFFANFAGMVRTKR